jgi:hypothetical protein
MGYLRHYAHVQSRTYQLPAIMMTLEHIQTPENAWPLPIYTLLNLLNPRMFSWVLET